MEAVEWSLELETETPGQLPLTPRLLAVCLALAVFGLLTSILLLAGVRSSVRMLFLPWLIFNVLIIISLLGAGLYLIILFTLLLEQPDYLRAALSSPLVLLGIFLIFVWVLVDQLFLALGHRKLLVRVTSSFRGSRASLTSRCVLSSHQITFQGSQFFCENQAPGRRRDSWQHEELDKQPPASKCE